jgi:hypothetical protein
MQRATAQAALAAAVIFPVKLDPLRPVRGSVTSG